MKELTQQELIRVFSAYLPYDLKIQTGNLSALNIKTHNMYGIVRKKEVISIINHSNTHIGFIEYCKPILWDLSMLTNEIEHEGEFFEPMEKLRKEWDCEAELQFLDALADDWASAEDKLQFAPYSVFQRLLEWHFNIFGLYESQYINKATLKN